MSKKAELQGLEKGVNQESNISKQQKGTDNIDIKYLWIYLTDEKFVTNLTHKLDSARKKEALTELHTYLARRQKMSVGIPWLHVL